MLASCALFYKYGLVVRNFFVRSEILVFILKRHKYAVKCEIYKARGVCRGPHQALWTRWRRHGNLKWKVWDLVAWEIRDADSNAGSLPV